MFTTFRIWITALVILAVLMLAGVVRAEDPDRDRKARVALAMADAREDYDRKVRVAMALHAADPVPIAAPAPRAKGCICGDDCHCKDDKCPACPSFKKDVLKVRDAVVRVRCGNAQGSGTVIWSDGKQSLVLTAAHVVAGTGAATVRGEGKTHAATVLGRDERADLAALLVAADLPAVRVSDADPGDGSEVLMVGLTSIWSRGRITGRATFDGFEVWKLSYDSDSGDSGGGVFVAGELVGVHCGKAGEPGVPYCASAKPVRAFLARILKRDGAKTVLVVPVPMPAAKKSDPPAKRILGYRQVCDNGRCYLIPIYEP